MGAASALLVGLPFHRPPSSALSFNLQCGDHAAHAGILMLRRSFGLALDSSLARLCTC